MGAMRTLSQHDGEELFGRLGLDGASYHSFSPVPFASPSRQASPSDPPPRVALAGTSPLVKLRTLASAHLALPKTELQALFERLACGPVYRNLGKGECIRDL